ncbi:hypothetical protein ACFVGM_06435 [Kitasatospora purpeofusca]|uniref:hypothetical protein n=1 Tax=Kitasatospora purpeofusca TaxID=67352 RepID=UPI0004C0119C
MFVEHAGVEGAIQYLSDTAERMEDAMRITKQKLDSFYGGPLLGVFSTAAENLSEALRQKDGVMIGDINSATQDLAKIHHILWSADFEAGRGMG